MSQIESEIARAISEAASEVGLPEDPTEEDFDRVTDAAMKRITSPEARKLLAREGLVMTVQEVLREAA